MFWLIFALPFLMTGLSLFIKRGFIWQECLIQFVASFAIGAAVLATGYMTKMKDVEVWNGEITSKERTHEHYLRSYSCNCVTTCSGGKNSTCTTTCQTCYEDRYTVSWDVNCTAGNINIDYKDWSDDDVYLEPDPRAYKEAAKGNFCAREHSYTNYVKAASSSLFNQDSKLDFSQYKVPSYPRVYNYYKFNRVFGFDNATNKLINTSLNHKLKKLGAKKQANIIVIGNEYDQNYRNAVEYKWKGGKKNDIIVLIGKDGSNTIKWVDTITLGFNSGNELMTVKMRDGLMALGNVDGKAISDTISYVVENYFDRKPMKEFEYLKDDIQPSNLSIALGFILCIISNIGIFVFFKYKKLEW